MNDTITKLRAAIAATSYPDWTHTHIYAGEEIISHYVDAESQPTVAFALGEADGQYIATFDPGTAALFVDLLEAIEGDVLSRQNEQTRQHCINKATAKVRARLKGKL